MAIIEKKGPPYQFTKVIEECDELCRHMTKLLQAYLDGGEEAMGDLMASQYEFIRAERADLENTLRSLDKIFGFEQMAVSDIRLMKLERAVQML